MQLKIVLTVAATLSIFSVVPAPAAILEVDFSGTTGTAQGTYVGFGCADSCVLAKVQPSRPPSCSTRL